MFTSLIGLSISGKRTAPLSELEGERRIRGRRWGGGDRRGGKERQRERAGREVRKAAQLDAALDQHASTHGTRDKRRGHGSR